MIDIDLPKCLGKVYIQQKESQEYNIQEYNTTIILFT